MPQEGSACAPAAAAHRGDELCALVPGSGDAPVGNALPAAAFPVDGDPSVVGTAFVAHLGGVPVGGKNPGDRPGGGLAADSVDFEFESKGLVFHGEAPFFRRRLFPPARVPGCRFWAVSRPADTSITPPGEKVNGFFSEKEPPASLYMREARRKKTEKTRFFFARPGTPPPGNPPAGNGKNPPGNPAGRPRPEPPGHTRRGRHPPPGHTARPEDRRWGDPSPGHTPPGSPPAAARPTCAKGGGGQIP